MIKKLLRNLDPAIEEVGDVRDLLSDAKAVEEKIEKLRLSTEIARTLGFRGKKQFGEETGRLRWTISSPTGEEVRVEERAVDNVAATKLWTVFPVEFDLPSGTINEATALRLAVLSLAERELRRRVPEFVGGETKSGSPFRFLFVRDKKANSDREFYWPNGPSSTQTSFDPPPPPEPFDDEDRIASLERFFLDVAREVARREAESEEKVDAEALSAARAALFGEEK